MSATAATDVGTSTDRRILRRERVATRSPWRQPLAVVGVALLVLWIAVAVFAPQLAPYDPLSQNSYKFLSPSWTHPFGTDEIGRDVFSRVLYGARISLPLAVGLVAVAMAFGTAVGAIAGYFGGWRDGVLMRSADLVFAFPGIVLAMAVTAALGPQLRNAVLAVAIVSWPSYARVVRGMVMSAQSADYLLSSRLLGASSLRAMAVDLRPNIAGPVLVLAALDVGNAVLLLSGLSFLGLGAQPPTAEWGAMVSAGAENFDKWWIAVFPGLAILTVVLAFNFIGDTLRDALDPRTARSGRA